MRPLALAGPRPWHRWAAALLGLTLTMATQPTRPAGAQGDCALAPFRERIDATLASMTIDHEETSAATDSRGQPFTRIDVGFSGTVDGCVTKGGPLQMMTREPYSWLYDAPDIALPQEHLLSVDRTKPYPLPIRAGDGNTSPRYYARAAFRAADGAGMTVLLPTAGTPWNGKLFLLQHGSGMYTPMEALTEPTPDAPLPAGIGRPLFAPAMMDQGYAVAYLRKDGVRPPLGASEAVLRDGTTLRTTFVGHAGIMVAMAEFAQRYVAQAMGQPPRRTYYYGHSGGGIAARITNYSGANVGHDGRPVIDGFIADDAGNGLYLPIAFEGGQDVLFRDAAERARLVPQIDVTRQLYNPLSYLPAKRLNAELLREKGLGEKHRLYEVRGVSHFDAGQLDLAGSQDVLDLGPLIYALAERLDAWVERGEAPPASKADAPGFDPALALPEVACPLGEYYAGPAGFSGNAAAQRTAFAAYDGASLEPVNADTGAFIDMNDNRLQDLRETVDAAWQRLGLLPAGQPFTPERYATCLSAAASDLVAEGLLPSWASVWYPSQAAALLERSGARWAAAPGA
ncbi:MAG TPA: alpha/beta hydrolase domain-containing protein [Chloroflexota bacterium]|nr:alpha/beta hydrolase domain-containing protein [Chloroflexota bacterium]